MILYRMMVVMMVMIMVEMLMMMVMMMMLVTSSRLHQRVLGCGEWQSWSRCPKDTHSLS